MTEENKELKNFNVRLPKDLWMFLKSQSALQEISMIDIIKKALEDYKIKVEYSLTISGTRV
jgi:predicted HicB family RNase H-like nuclease